MPEISAPDEFRAIVNAHFRIAPPAGTPPITGVFGGTVEWIFAFEDRVSVTISAADALVDVDRETLAKRLWGDVAKVLGLPSVLPPWQIVKEKRATFAATPEQDALRSTYKPLRAWPNLFLGRATGPRRVCPPPSRARCVPGSVRLGWHSPATRIIEVP